MKALTPAQRKTLTTIIAHGGTMNGYAGQKGFYGNSLGPLERMGLIEFLDACNGTHACLSTVKDCQRPVHGEVCYNLVRITEAGQVAVQD